MPLLSFGLPGIGRRQRRAAALAGPRPPRLRNREGSQRFGEAQLVTPNGRLEGMKLGLDRGGSVPALPGASRCKDPRPVAPGGFTALLGARGGHCPQGATAAGAGPGAVVREGVDRDGPLAERAVPEGPRALGPNREEPGWPAVESPADFGEGPRRAPEREPAGGEPLGVPMPLEPALLLASAGGGPPTRGAGGADGSLRGVRRMAWGGDGRRGVARLEIAVGPLAGAEILVEVVGCEVEVSISAPLDPVKPDLAERLRARLGDRGLTLRRFDVT